MSTFSIEKAAATPPAAPLPFPSAWHPESREPIRGESCGLESLDTHARALARACRIARQAQTEGPLLLQVERNGRLLLKAYRSISEVATRRMTLTPDAEWLLDNFYIVEEVLREVRHDLPRGYYKKLPKLAGTALAGYPRVFVLALSLITHTDSNLDEAHITRFVQAFQTVAPLTIGELWAVPTMLRLSLLENLGRMSEHMLQVWQEHRRAEEWVEPLLQTNGERGRVSAPSGVHGSLTQPSSPLDLSDSFVVRALQVLRQKGRPEALERVEAYFHQHRLDVNEIVRRQNQRQAVNQVSVGNCMTSLRLLSALDWNVFFERTNLVEPLLRQDPAEAYGQQDFATRDRYRQAVEKLSRGSDVEEVAVAQRVLQRAAGQPSPRDHVGYYLIGPGKAAFRAELGYRRGIGERLLDVVLSNPRAVYFGSIAALWIALLILFLWLGVATNGSVVSHPWLWLLTAVAALLPVSELAVAAVNYLLTLALPPRMLPKLEYKEGLPPDCAAFVVMPSLLVNRDSATALTERLEIHYLANPDPQLRFALLTDFTDAATEHRPEDEDFLRDALDRIAALNRRYASQGPPRFFLFHRKRQWNPSQDCWMGWERKRGKLAEFNRLLRGDANTSYSIKSAEVDNLPRIRYVITLDLDTQLPHETARRLVGALAHPLNRARFDSAQGRVVDGYAILQPRISFHVPAAQRSRFAFIGCGSAGLDPYAAAVSDIYQDLFGAGSFTGKGIYEVDAFQSAVGRTFPDNQILSHDLIEGNYARCGLVTDIELFDDFPPRYLAYARREHRWIRGDWQLLPWLASKVPSPDGGRPNPLPMVERWKILDNLRRSLVPPALVLWLVLSWTVLPVSWVLASVLVLLVLALPLLLQISGTLFHAAKHRTSTGLRELARSGWTTAAQALQSGIVLLYQSHLSLDAIVRTLIRLKMTRRRLLEWETAASTERRLGASWKVFAKTMWPVSVAAVGLAALVQWVRPQAMPAAAGFLLAWLLSPLVAWWISQQRRPREQPLSESERRELGAIARKTWGFFESFVGAEDHWLPPDNFQEEPRHQVAHRTSPTNQGLLLLSTLAAHDFGYLTLGSLLDRLEKTFDTLERLERHHGHFYNWYDTRSLQPLRPTYISTVDSANLLGCLLTLRQGLLEKKREPLAGASAANGLCDTLQVIKDVFAEASARREPSGTDTAGRLMPVIGRLETAFAETPREGSGWTKWLAALKALAEELAAEAHRLLEAGYPRAVELELWTRRFLSLIDKRDQERTESALSDSLRERCERLAERAEALARDMDFRFLYKPDRHLFAIGYSVAQGKLDAACYDLLASEARLASFLAVARGDVPRRHWFHLSRTVVRAGDRLCLVSWGGTMFEYLMPQLLLRRYAGTLLEESCTAAVDEQMAYGTKRRVPWGISESAFSAQYASFDYQYQTFGVPTLGLKRGLGQDLVVAPYATALATIVRPHQALANFRRLASEGAAGKYGFYESIDYTRGRLPEAHRSLVVRCFMAHHQGMSLTALANCLLDAPMVRRFHAEPMVRAAELLLQERVPAVAVPVDTPDEEIAPRSAAPGGGDDLFSRRLTTPNTPGPRTHLLSNGQYLVMLTNAGAGFSRCGELDVTRWREDYTRDDRGQFCYIHDLQSGLIWSAGHQPICRPAKKYEVIYSADKAEYRRLDGAIATHLEITVAPEHCAEVRRLTLTNNDKRGHELELTSYAEVVLAPHNADLMHPAFGKLFVETEWVPSHDALLCHRRTRSAKEETHWAAHVFSVDGPSAGAVEYETDRARFLGRGRTPAAPAALDPGVTLSNTTGSVLDPIFSVRRRLRLEAGATVTVLICTGVAKSREDVLALADHFRDGQAVARVFDLAWAHSQVELRHLQINTSDVHLFQRLASHLLYASPATRAPADVLAANRQGQTALWRYGISGEKPILLVRISAADDLPLVRHLLLAHSYWRLKGLPVDLLLLSEEPASYVEELFQRIQEAVRSSHSHDLVDRPGGVFVRKASQISEEDQRFLQAAARVVLNGRRGSLSVQVEDLLDRAAAPEPLPERLAIDRAHRKASGASQAGITLPTDLLFANGWGGFTSDGREYCILPYQAGQSGTSNPQRRQGTKPHFPPAPWINVVANPQCGFLVSESALGYTWTCNSQQFRLTPWSNDPTSDPPAEVVYLRDEESGDVWTPTPRPLGLIAPTLVRHGQGYTVFEQRSHGLEQELRVFVPPDDPIKLIVVKLRNTSDRPRRLTATYYAEWVLGTVRDEAAMNVRTALDDDSGALLARNPFAADFAEQVAFADVDQRPRTVTGDRTEFLGRNHSVDAPAALERVGLSGRVGPALDPCAAVQTALELGPHQEREVVFFLGSAADIHTVRNLLRRYKEPRRVQAAWEQMKENWDRVLSAVQVRTPDAALDVLLNRWLLYQVLSCRVWGRSAFYQSGGAYGFRDQLQDVMALVYAAPQEARAQILRAAARQFLEGDVQHWWHPPAGRGVRTRISDDYLFLPFVVCHYVSVTADAGILDEKVPFLSAPVLKPGQEEDYGEPKKSDESGTIYEHCLRALRHGLRFGAHGLPLMGAGDWNDGMNRVGIEGKGESVWNGWFLLTCLRQFAEVADGRGDREWADTCRAQAEHLRRSIEENAWDGAWYRRAYFDDGTPLGSAQNDECKIDSIAQSWSVWSGGDPQRARQAMDAVDERLVRREDGLIRLFAPPFDRGHLHPGYIRGYVPGIRENGGQYTHAATWVVQAAARLGQGARAKEYFDLISPVKHTRTPEQVERYRVEPYVVVADIYGEPPHTGRGGWTWYTGSAAWLYRVALEAILGFQRRGDRLHVDPCIPKDWPSFTILYRHRSATYRIQVENPHGVERGVKEVHLDGQTQEGKDFALMDDGKTHEVRVVLG